MEPGWIYVLVNSSMPGLAKVGRTSRPPSERAAELSSATGVATPFVLAFDQPVADCSAAERAIHAELDRRGLRVAANREFFRGPPSEIVRVVLEEAAGGTGSSEPNLVATAPTAQALLEAGDCYLIGAGDVLQDTREAIRLYRLAASRGALQAFERLGRVYVDQYVARPDGTARRRALSPLQQGIRRGNAYCFTKMATLFAAERNLGNFAKAWALFFAGLTQRAQDSRLASACCRYVDACLDLGIEPAHGDVLATVAHAMVPLLLAEREQTRGTPAQPRVARVLRWIYLRGLQLPTPALAPLPGRGDAWARHSPGYAVAPA